MNLKKIIFTYLFTVLAACSPKSRFATEVATPTPPPSYPAREALKIKAVEPAPGVGIIVSNDNKICGGALVDDESFVTALDCVPLAEQQNCKDMQIFINATPYSCETVKKVVRSPEPKVPNPHFAVLKVGTKEIKAEVGHFGDLAENQNYSLIDLDSSTASLHKTTNVTYKGKSIFVPIKYDGTDIQELSISLLAYPFYFGQKFIPGSAVVDADNRIVGIAVDILPRISKDSSLEYSQPIVVVQSQCIISGSCEFQTYENYKKNIEVADINPEIIFPISSNVKELLKNKLKKPENEMFDFTLKTFKSNDGSRLASLYIPICYRKNSKLRAKYSFKNWLKNTVLNTKAREFVELQILTYHPEIDFNGTLTPLHVQVQKYDTQMEFNAVEVYEPSLTKERTKASVLRVKQLNFPELLKREFELAPEMEDVTWHLPECRA